MAESTNKTLGLIVTLVTIGAAVVSATLYAANASANAATACKRVDETECRLRTVEQTLPRIDEKLSNIERMLAEQRATKP